MSSRHLQWRTDAACRDDDTSIFFSDDPADAARAVAMCAECPVRQACLEFALDSRQADGIWGGLTEMQRRRERRRRRASAAA